LEPWLGKPRVKQGRGRATLIYSFESTAPSKSTMSLKVEINTREHYNFLDLIEKSFTLSSPWYSGSCQIQTYPLDELLGTKLRALYQRKKGRDLFDMARAVELLPINIERILDCFNHYLAREEKKVSRAEFEANLLGKKEMLEFRKDIEELLPYSAQHNFDYDFALVMDQIIAKLPGDAWKGARRIGKYMGRPGITQADVYKAAQAIAESGAFPTIQSVHARIGSGSLVTIHKHLLPGSKNALLAPAIKFEAGKDAVKVKTLVNEKLRVRKNCATTNCTKCSYVGSTIRDRARKYGIKSKVGCYH
jgi:hypothetical protein